MSKTPADELVDLLKSLWKPAEKISALELKPEPKQEDVSYRELQAMASRPRRVIRVEGIELEPRHQLDERDIMNLLSMNIPARTIQKGLDIAKLRSAPMDVNQIIDMHRGSPRPKSKPLVPFIGPVAYLLSLMSDEELRRLGLKTSDDDTLNVMSTRLHEMRDSAKQAHDRLNNQTTG